MDRKSISLIFKWLSEMTLTFLPIQGNKLKKIFKKKSSTAEFQAYSFMIKK